MSGSRQNRLMARSDGVVDGSHRVLRRNHRGTQATTISGAVVTELSSTGTCAVSESFGGEAQHAGHQLDPPGQGAGGEDGVVGGQSLDEAVSVADA